MGERPGRGGAYRNGELCSGKTSRISSARVFSWIHSESPAARQSSGRPLATAYLRVKTSNIGLWRRQAVSGGPGRIAVFAGRSSQTLKSLLRPATQAPVISFFQCKTDF